MSTTNDRELPGPTPAAIQHLMRPPTEDRDEIIRRAVAGNRIMAGRFPGDEARIRKRAGRAFDRCFHPAGTARQMLASIAAESRTDALAELRVPALVIHGSEDPLVPVACGIATTKAIPNAQLEIVDGMGHDLPREAWSRIVAAIAGVVDRAAAQ